VTPTASLPMYNLPEMRAVNARFWEVLRGLLVEAGLRDLPESLTFGRSTARELRDLRGGVFLFNSRHSNSGMNLPRRALADIADGRPFFAKVIETGSHPGNLDRIASGEADATAVDNVTYAFWCHYRPAAARHVRVLGRTPASPAIPFVTSVATAPATVAILRDALTRLGREPHAAAVRADLSITDIVDVPAAAYSRLLEYEREAAELGYPELA
jgi:ABC-type phosphate/phosphonate transport system substrate-binding protein